MGLDISRTTFRPESAFRILIQQSGYQVTRLGFARRNRRDSWKLERLFHDATQRSFVCYTRKRRTTVDHFVDEDPERPPVDGIAVGLAGSDFRSNVLVSADEGTGSSVHRFRHEQAFGGGEGLDFLRSEELTRETRERMRRRT